MNREAKLVADLRDFVGDKSYMIILSNMVAHGTVVMTVNPLKHKADDPEVLIYCASDYFTTVNAAARLSQLGLVYKVGAGDVCLS